MIFSQSSVVGALTLALGLFSQTAAAASTGTVGTQDVYVPPVLTPDADTVWFTGRTYNVTWYVAPSPVIYRFQPSSLLTPYAFCRDTSDPPAQITNRYGRILLRKGDFTTPSTSYAKNYQFCLYSLVLCSSMNSFPRQRLRHPRRPCRGHSAPCRQR